MRTTDSSSPQPSVSQTAPDFISRQVHGSRLFFLNLTPGKAKKLTVVCGGFESCTPDYSINRASFDWYSVEYVSEGRGQVVLNGKKHALNPGMFFVYGPDTAHQIVCDPEKPLSKYFVDFTGAEVPKLLETLRLLPGTIAECMSPGNIRDDFDTLLHMGIRRRQHAELLCSARLTELLVNCSEGAAIPGSIGTRAYSTFERCREKINTDFLHLRSLRDIALTCHVDAAYLCRLFARFGKEPPHQYLLRLKINRAAELLLDGDPPVKKVAEIVGFPDPFHFSKVFRKLHGVPPARFALRHRQIGSGQISAKTAPRAHLNKTES